MAEKLSALSPRGLRNVYFYRVATVLEIREKSGKTKNGQNSQGKVREKSGNLRKKETSQGQVRKDEKQLK